MIGRVIEIVLGVAVVVLAVRDVFDTVVVPGESRGALRIARRLLLVMLPVWMKTSRQDGNIDQFRPLRADGVVRRLDAPAAVRIWSRRLVLAAGGFRKGAVHRGQRAVHGRTQRHRAHGPARWVLVAAGLCELAVLTMAVTYLLEVQEGISRQDC
jgi:hypothetical protein